MTRNATSEDRERSRKFVAYSALCTLLLMTAVLVTLYSIIGPLYPSYTAVDLANCKLALETNNASQLICSVTNKERLSAALTANVHGKASGLIASATLYTNSGTLEERKDAGNKAWSTCIILFTAYFAFMYCLSYTMCIHPAMCKKDEHEEDPNHETRP